MSTLQEIKSLKYQGLEVEFGKLESEGEFVGGTKTFTFKSVTINGINFDTKTKYEWDDPDFPEGYDEEIEKATKKADKVGGEWPDFLDWSKQTYRFKSEGFMAYVDSEGLNIDALPTTALGRIAVKELIISGNDKTPLNQ